MTREQMREVVARALWETPLPTLCGTAEELRRCDWATVLAMAADGHLAEEEDLNEFRAMADAAITALWPLFAEHAAGVAQGFATCECGGIHGRCVEDDAPLAIAAAIRAEGAPK